MSEATAAPAPAAPTNGAKSATTAPAPGTTSTPPTPKNGEGAVAKPPEAPKSPWADFGGEVEITYKGEKRKVAVKSADDIARLAQRAQLSDSAAKEAAELRRWRQEVLDHAGKDPTSILKAMGVDPEAFILKQAEEMLKRQEMTAEQRQVEQERQARAAAEAERDRIKAEWERVQQERALDAQWQEEGPQWEAALKARSRVGDKRYITAAAARGEYLAKHGIEATPEQICADVDEYYDGEARRFAESSPAKTFEAIAEKLDPALVLKALGTRLTPEMLWAALQSDDARRAIGSMVVAWHKGTKTQPPAAPMRSRDTKGKYLSESEWREAREKK